MAALACPPFALAAHNPGCPLPWSGILVLAALRWPPFALNPFRAALLCLPCLGYPALASLCPGCPFPDPDCPTLVPLLWLPVAPAVLPFPCYSALPALSHALASCPALPFPWLPLHWMPFGLPWLPYPGYPGCPALAALPCPEFIP